MTELPLNQSAAASYTSHAATSTSDAADAATATADADAATVDAATADAAAATTTTTTADAATADAAAAMATAAASTAAADAAAADAAAAAADAATTTSDDDSEPEPDISVGQRVLVYFHHLLYKAKIIHIHKYADRPAFWRYYIHYEDTDEVPKWKGKWDEWVSPMRILERGNRNEIINAQRVALSQSALKPKIHRLPEERLDDNNKVNGMWKDDIYEEKAEIDSRCGTALPMLLFVRLIEDREVCVHMGRILRPPHLCTIATIVQQFKSYLREQKRPKLFDNLLNKWVEHFNSHVRDYLIESEREVFDHVYSEVFDPVYSGSDIDTTPCDVYGVEHLLRLLVALPKSLLKYRRLEKKDVIELLAEFFSFLEKNEGDFYHVNK